MIPFPKIRTSAARWPAMVGHGLAVAAIAGLIGWKIHEHRRPADGAEVFPSRPVEVVVPYGAGGGTDTVARLVQRAISRERLLPEPMIIINRAGGSGTIGSRQVKNAKPDGYTILCLDEGVITSKLSGMVPFGAEGFQPIAQSTQNTTVVVVRDDAPFRDLPALMARAVAEPGTLRFGVPLGTPPHYTAKELQKAVQGGEFNFVQGMGAQKRYSLLLGAHIDVAILSLPEVLAYRAGPGTPSDRQIRALAVLLPERHSSLPEVPTALEDGIKVMSGNGIYWWAPKGTPPERVATLASAIGAAMESPGVREEMRVLSLDPRFRSGSELEGWLQERTATLSQVAFDSRIELPNLPLYTAILVLAFGIGLLALRVAQGPSVAPEGGSSGRHAAAVCAIIVVAYVMVLSAGLVAYAIATAAMVFAVGVVISGSARARLPVFAELAIIAGLGTDLIFTNLFNLILP